jgi:hypothetical protein
MRAKLRRTGVSPVSILSVEEEYGDRLEACPTAYTTLICTASTICSPTKMEPMMTTVAPL